MGGRRDFKNDPKARFKAINRLSEDEARKEIEALREGIDYHDHLYYVRNRPKISDELYDKMFRRVEELEEAFPRFQSATSPTRRVGAEPAEELESIEHTAPMLSLKAALQEKDVDGFHRFIREQTGRENIRYVLEPKIDGVSVEAVYERGRFARGATRGDGQRGENISENLKTVRSLPMRLSDQKSAPGVLAVRGEVLMSKDAFQEVNKRRIERNQDPYANPRNATAGIVRRLESKEVARWPLDILFYDILPGGSFLPPAIGRPRDALWLA